MIEDVKRGLKAIIENNVVELSGKIFSTYPKSSASMPCACLDVVSNAPSRNLSADYNYFLVRISVFAGSRLKLDQLTDEVMLALIQHGNELTAGKFFGLSSTSPTTPAFEDREDRWRRDIDVRVLVAVVR